MTVLVIAQIFFILTKWFLNFGSSDFSSIFQMKNNKKRQDKEENAGKFSFSYRNMRSRKNKFSDFVQKHEKQKEIKRSNFRTKHGRQK